MTDRLSIVGSRRYGSLSPLRYPGGKAALAGFFADIIKLLDLDEPRYIEPYAGGAGAGIALLRAGVIQHLVINDIDPAVYSFWKSVIDENENLLDLVSSIPLTVEEWRRQRQIYRERNQNKTLELGFAFFFLNRTNRSGILNAGVIGGQRQDGRYKIDARFNRKTLTDRLRAIGALGSQITVSDLDGRTVIRQYSHDSQSFMYIDPPYVRAGSQLYLNAFDGRDHRALSAVVNSVDKAHWLMTYDAVPLIENIYRDRFQCRLELTYSARHPGRAEELLMASSAVARIIRKMESMSALAGQASV